MNPRLIRHRPSRGATLIEVLVAFLIVSLAFLGSARLLASATHQQKTTQLRLIALSLANQHVARARLNLFGVDRNAYQLNEGSVEPPMPAINPDEATAANAADNVAAADTRELLLNARALLPGGDARVQTTSTLNGGRDMQIWLFWTEAASDTSAELQGATDSQCPTGAVAAGRRCLFLKAGL